MLTEQSVCEAYGKLHLLTVKSVDTAESFDSLLAEVGKSDPMIAKIIRNEIAIHHGVPHQDDDDIVRDGPLPLGILSNEEVDLMAVAMVRLAYLIIHGDVDDPEQQDRALREDTK